MLRLPLNGVLLPAELDNATPAERDAYAAKVKRDNAAFCAAYFALEDQAATIGLTMEDLGGRI